MIGFLRRLFRKPKRTAFPAISYGIAEPGFFPPGSWPIQEPTNMEKIICMKAFGNPAKLELMRSIAMNILFGIYFPDKGTAEQCQAFREAYQWYTELRRTP